VPIRTQLILCYMLMLVIYSGPGGKLSFASTIMCGKYIIYSIYE